MDVPYVRVDWAKDIETPFTNGGKTSSDELAARTELKAPGYDLVDPSDVTLTLDEPDRQFNRHFKCIIIGTSKDSHLEEETICYVLVVEAVGETKPSIYERVGVAKLKRTQIAFNAPRTAIIVQ